MTCACGECEFLRRKQCPALKGRDEWQKAQRQAKRIGQSSRPAQSVRAWANHIRRALRADQD